MAKEDGIIAAPERLKVRLDTIDQMVNQRMRDLQTEAQGQANGFIMGAADALDLELGGDEGWQYERDENRFRITSAKRPGDRGWPPEMPANMEVLPPKPTEQEVTAAPNGHATMDVTVPFTPRRARRAAAKA